MNESFLEYLDTIGIRGALLERISGILAKYGLLAPQLDILDMFVSEAATRVDGPRVFENLWLFSKDFAMEAKAFQTEDNCDIMAIRDLVFRFEFRSENYDFEKAVDRSSLTFLCMSPAEGGGGLMHASGSNCDQLLRIVRSQFLPLMLDGGARHPLGQ